jgi:hypothetical protein
MEKEKVLLIDPYTRGEKIEGYSYLIEQEGKIIACGYYKKESHARFYGEKALAILVEASA